MVIGWGKCASMLGWRTYNYNLAESMTPFAKLTTWSHDIPYLARHNFVGISLESFPTWDLSAPTIYLSLRLAYSPFADAAAILDDFYRGFYGPAAGPMRAYWDAVDNGWQSLPTESGAIYSVHLVVKKPHVTMQPPGTTITLYGFLNVKVTAIIILKTN